MLYFTGRLDALDRRIDVLHAGGDPVFVLSSSLANMAQWESRFLRRGLEPVAEMDGTRLYRLRP